jgi:pimeloyl-ACP methyl ester carboxylesterase
MMDRPSEVSVRLPSGELRCRDAGEGPVVVLLHGLGSGADLWDDVAPTLAERMRVLTPDLADGIVTDSRTLAGQVRGLLEHLGIDECAVVGHGMGAVGAQWLALGGGVRCLVLMDAGPADPSGTVDLAAGSGPDASALSRLEVPTLVLWGEDDPYLPVGIADGLAEALSLSTLVLLPGCGHFLPREAPDTVATLTAEFLRARYLGLPHHHDHSAPSGPVPVELRRAHGPA